jgi:hypothetical protein
MLRKKQSCISGWEILMLSRRVENAKKGQEARAPANGFILYIN